MWRVKHLAKQHEIYMSDVQTENDNQNQESPSTDEIVLKYYNISQKATTIDNSTSSTVLKISGDRATLNIGVTAKVMDIGTSFTGIKASVSMTGFQEDYSLFTQKNFFILGNFRNTSVILDKAISIEKFAPTRRSDPFKSNGLNEESILDSGEILKLNSLHEPPINLKLYKVFNVERRSAFELAQPPSFTYTHLQLTEHNNRGYAFGQGLSANNITTFNSLKYRNVNNAQGLQFALGENGNHTTAWMEDGKARWIKFPGRNDLLNAFGSVEGDTYYNLLSNADEYIDSLAAINAINAGYVTPFMNLSIPVIANTRPDRIATPLKGLPETMEYNNKYGGHLNLILERGHVQKHVLVSGAGPNFYFGGTTNYYMHGRNMIHMQGHSELTNVYKLLVYSNATYHYRCQPPLEYSQAGFGNLTRTDERVPINYRYEGDFNIEQVSVNDNNVDDTDNNVGMNVGTLQHYNFGIHGIKNTREIRARAGIISLQYIAPETPYTNAELKTAPASQNYDAVRASNAHLHALNLERDASAAERQAQALNLKLREAGIIFFYRDDEASRNMFNHVEYESQKAEKEAVSARRNAVAARIAANHAAQGAPARTVAPGPKIEIAEKAIDIALAKDKYIRLSQDRLVIKHGAFYLQISDKGIELNGAVLNKATTYLKFADAKMTINDRVELAGNSAKFKTVYAGMLNAKKVNEG